MRGIFIILFFVASLGSYGQGRWTNHDTTTFTAPTTLGVLVVSSQYHYSRAVADTITIGGYSNVTINDSATTTSLLINFPANPISNQTLNIQSINAVSTGVTISPTVLGSITGLTANGTWGWIYNSTLGKWVRKN